MTAIAVHKTCQDGDRQASETYASYSEPFSVLKTEDWRTRLVIGTAV